MACQGLGVWAAGLGGTEISEIEGVTGPLGTDFTSWVTQAARQGPYRAHFAGKVARDCKRAGAPLPPVARAALESPSPPVIVTYTSQYLAYAVTGTGSADITYGTDSIYDSPPGSGLGSGTAVPWSGSLPYAPNQNALYYLVTAQLQGSGDISCSVSLVTVTHYSNGTKYSTSQVLATGSASGGFNICTAERVDA